MRRIKTSDAVKMGISGTFRKNISVPMMITNSDVRNIYLMGVKNSGIISGSNFRLIENLVDKQRIVPVECTNDFIKTMNRNLKGDACMNPKDYENVLGFYTGRQNRLYILMDNISRLMKNNRKGLFNVTIHELQHMCCYNFVKDFISTWSQEFCRFYASFFAHLLSQYQHDGFFSHGVKNTTEKLLRPENGIFYYIQYIIYNYEYLYCCAGSTITSKDCMVIGDKVEQILRQCGAKDEAAYKCGKDVSNMVYNVLAGRISSTFRGSDKNTIMCFRAAYMDVFGVDPWKNGTFVYQEIIFPSEVICIASEFQPKDQRLYKFLNYL